MKLELRLEWLVGKIKQYSVGEQQNPTFSLKKLIKWIFFS